MIPDAMRLETEAFFILAIGYSVLRSLSFVLLSYKITEYSKQNLNISFLFVKKMEKSVKSQPKKALSTWFYIFLNFFRNLHLVTLRHY
jgi:hypothetical protein